MAARFGSTLKRWTAASAGVSRPSKVPAGVYVAVQAAIVLIIAVLLGVFSPSMVRPESLPRVGPLLEPDGFLARTFCAWAFLLAYGAVRLAIWAVRLFLSGDDAEFADIRTDWEEALRELDRAGLSLREAPLFLTIGLGRAEETRFFGAAARTWAVISPPAAKISAAVRIYADDKGVYVSCSNVGAAAAQRDLKAAPSAPGHGAGDGTIVPGANAALYSTLPGNVPKPPTAPNRPEHHRHGHGEARHGEPRHGEPDLGSTVAPGDQNSGHGGGGYEQEDDYGATIAPGGASTGPSSRSSAP